MRAYVVSMHHLHFYKISVQSLFEYGCQVAILANQLGAITLELMDHLQILIIDASSKD
jgi:hypothetical protein